MARTQADVDAWVDLMMMGVDAGFFGCPDAFELTVAWTVSSVVLEPKTLDEDASLTVNSRGLCSLWMWEGGLQRMIERREVKFE